VATELTTHITDPMVVELVETWLSSLPRSVSYIYQTGRSRDMVFESFKSFPAIEFMQAKDVAEAILYALTQETRVDVNEILVRSTE
jgi:NADP-dependent 3-hydroxy acid dehydrogenase YdfG